MIETITAKLEAGEALTTEEIQVLISSSNEELAEFKKDHPEEYKNMLLTYNTAIKNINTEIRSATAALRGLE